MTAGCDRMPDFFICGAARSGTTSLWRYLQQHPSIFMPTELRNKEPGYFSQLCSPTDRSLYTQLFKDARPDQTIGEASGAYLTSPDSAGRIAATVPRARIIIMLRNPADRAFSLYRWMVREGFEWVRSFERALECERRRRLDNGWFRRSNPQYYYNYLYFYSGLYASQVERYLSAFDRSQIQFVVFEEFVDDARSCLEKTFRHLGVDPSFEATLGVYNEGRDVRFPSLQYLLRCWVERPLHRVFGSRAADWMRSLRELNRSDRQRQLDPNCRRRLLGAYREDIQTTAGLIGRDLESVWR